MTGGTDVTDLENGVWRPRISVVVPAHNERQVIRRCLESVLRAAPAEQLEVLVVCNGCTDGTEQEARAVSAELTVLETPVASKHAALNLGDEAARGEVRVFLDADTVVSPGAFTMVADTLERPGVLAAAPEIRFDDTACSWAARQFHRVWRHSPYFGDGLVGAGCYALSSEGRARFERFPPIVADDAFVQAIFAPGERATARGASFTPLLPTTLRSMLAVHLRHYGAHAELEQWWAHNGSGPLPGAPAHGDAWVLGLTRSPSRWVGIVIFAAVKVIARVLGARKYRRGDMDRWNRDERARSTAEDH